MTMDREGREGGRLKITLNEALSWKKTLAERHAELCSLRNENSKERTRYLGANVEKSVVEKPQYDVKVLDKMITRVATEQRKLDMAIKSANAKTVLEDYEQNDEVLGELA